MDRARRNVTLAVLVGALAPPALAYLGYIAAGTPHVDCGDTAGTAAFYRVALPFFALSGLVGSAAVVLIARMRTEAKRHRIAESLAVLAAVLALESRARSSCAAATAAPPSAGSVASTSCSSAGCYSRRCPR